MMLRRKQRTLRQLKQYQQRMPLKNPQLSMNAHGRSLLCLVRLGLQGRPRHRETKLQILLLLRQFRDKAVSGVVLVAVERDAIGAVLPPLETQLLQQ
jgi:hypothetical protein